MADLPLLTINTDGGSRGNPGEASFGYIIARPGVKSIENGGRLGVMTNNQAEYTALVRALRHALKLGANHSLLIHSDSELMVKQMRGEYKVKNADLRGLYEEAVDLVEKFQGKVTFKHVRREYNKRADELCNEALDGLREDNEDGEVTSAEPAPMTLKSAVLAFLKTAGELPDEQAWQQLSALLAKHGVTLPE